MARCLPPVPFMRVIGLEAKGRQRLVKNGSGLTPTYGHSATGAWSQEISLLSSSRSPHSMTMAHTSPLALWKWLHRNAHQLEQRWEAWRFQRRRRLGRIKPVHIVPFLGYGNASKAVLGGRMLEKKPLGRPREDAPWWENVRAMIQRWASAEIPHVRLAARCNGQVIETT